MGAPVVVLAGGTGGARLASGMAAVAGEDLVVVANTGDDVEAYGAHVSPDPDLCLFWLAGRIDERGWGLDGDTFAAMEQLRELGEEAWFQLGDRDLAIGLWRAGRLAGGERLTDVLVSLGEALGISGRVLPMSDDPVRSWVLSGGEWHPFQEFMIRERAAGQVDGVELRGIEAAAPPPEVLEVLAGARAIVIGPSNPVISIRPILDVPGMREALAVADAPVVAVSPIVGGRVLKGPTDAFMAWARCSLDAAGVTSFYGGLLDGIVCDEEDPGVGIPALVTDTLLDTPAARERVARDVLAFAEGLA